MKLLYNIFIMLSGTIPLTLYITPALREILAASVARCCLNVSLSSMITPRNRSVCLRSIEVPDIFRSISSIFLFEKSIYLVLDRFSFKPFNNTHCSSSAANLRIFVSTICNVFHYICVVGVQDELR